MITDDTLATTDGRPLDTTGEDGRTALHGIDRVVGLLQILLDEFREFREIIETELGDI